MKSYLAYDRLRPLTTALIFSFFIFNLSAQCPSGYQGCNSTTYANFYYWPTLLNNDCNEIYFNSCLSTNVILNNVITFSWDFGDGTSLSQNTIGEAFKTYQNSGSYVVTLTVTGTIDGQMVNETCSQIITIGPECFPLLILFVVQNIIQNP